MADWASSGRIKIERAKEHIDNLEAELIAYRDRHGYTVVPEKNNETGRTIARMKFSEQPPVFRWGAIAGDAVHNLRSALDCMVWLSVGAALGHEPASWAKFHIVEAPKKLESPDFRKIEAASKAIADLIRATKPYLGGNDDLWILHRLDVHDKHRVLVPAVTALKRVEISMADGPPIVMNIFRPAEHDAELLNLPPRQKKDEKAHFVFNVAFAEPEIVKGKSVLPALRQLSQLVNGIADQFLAAGVLS